MTSWRTKWSNEHDDEGLGGLQEKFAVRETSSGEEITGTDELVFVLRPESDRAAHEALKIYALVARRRAPKLALELLDRLQVIEKRNRRARIDARDPA